MPEKWWLYSTELKYSYEYLKPKIEKYIGFCFQFFLNSTRQLGYFFKLHESALSVEKKKEKTPVISLSFPLTKKIKSLIF